MVICGGHHHAEVGSNPILRTFHTSFALSGLLSLRARAGEPIPEKLRRELREYVAQANRARLELAHSHAKKVL
jgi:hypothetical protein